MARRRRRRRRRGSPPWRMILILALAGLALFQAGRLVFTRGGRYWAAQHVWRGNPARVKPVVEEALADAARALDLPPPAPQLICEPDSVTGKSLCATVIRMGPGSSTIQGNAAITEALTRLGLELSRGDQTAGGAVNLLFHAGGKTDIRLTLLPADGTGLDSLVTPAPGLPEVEVTCRIALVIHDYGRNAALSQRFHDLPGVFTAAVHPERENAQATAEAARAAGMEILLDLPMEPKNYPTQNPGDNAVLVDLSGRSIRGLVKRDLERVGPVTGIKTFMGGLAVEDRDVMRAVLDETGARDLFFLDTTLEQYSVVEELAREIGVPVLTLGRVGRIDERTNDSGSILLRFNDFVEQCRADGYGFGVIHTKEGTLTVLEDRLAALAREGVVVMGLSQIVQARAVDTHPRRSP